jgi:ketosteroid isomerase-like protein
MNRPTAGDLTARVESYFASVDRSDLAGILATMTPDCVVEYVTDGSRFEGRDAGVRDYFEKRNAMVVQSWHGNVRHAADAASGRVATRFEVRRTDKGAAERFGDNINLFEFAGDRIARIAVWRGTGKLR